MTTLGALLSIAWGALVIFFWYSEMPSKRVALYNIVGFVIFGYLCIACPALVLAAFVIAGIYFYPALSDKIIISEVR